MTCASAKFIAKFREISGLLQTEIKVILFLSGNFHDYIL